MNRSLWLLFALLFLLGPAAALAAPGDGAPPDMDDEEEEEEEDTEPGGSAPPDTDDDEEEAPADEDEAPADEDKAPADEDEAPADEEAEEPGEAAPEEDEDALDDRYSLPPLDDSEEEEEEAEEPARARPSADDSDDEDEDDADLDEDQPQKRRGLVKVIQRKFFLKYRRVEITPMIGGMLTDDFINRLAVGALINIHVNEILAFELLGNYLPDLQATDYKPLTNRLKNRDGVYPEVSRIVGTFTGNLSLSPIYGKIELGTLRVINYDIYVSAGAGVVSTVDDTLLAEDSSECVGLSRQQNQERAACQYINEEHFVTSIGAGFRVVFNDFVGIRLDGRGFAHVERLLSPGKTELTLAMKQNFQLSFGVSFFVPPTARSVQ